jgi:hypothetical protein
MRTSLYPRVRARAVEGGVGHVGGDAQPGQVHGLQLLAALVGEVGVSALVEDVPGADGVAADALVGMGGGDRPREGIEPPLAGAVGGVAGRAALAGP